MDDDTPRSGPLAGVEVIELAGIGPGPMAGMLLADMGARVVHVARPGGTEFPGHGIMHRNRTHVAVDLKSEEGVEVVRRLAADADALYEGFRPGVLERLGLGPDVLLSANPALVIGRMTGWGQDGPWAHAAGHDINYIAVTGALAAIGRNDAGPSVPLNLVGDFGGGALYLVMGLLAGIIHSRATGQGQVVDAAMVDGTSSLLAMFHDLHTTGQLRLERGTNLLDSGAWFYDVYECADGNWISIGPIEPQFRRRFCDLVGLDEVFDEGDDPRTWPDLSRQLAAVIARQPRAHWDDLLAGTDACYAPVLDLVEARSHPHLAARGTFVQVDGTTQPAPAPRFSATQPDHPRGQRGPGADTMAVVTSLGYTDQEAAEMVARGVIGSD